MRLPSGMRQWSKLIFSTCLWLLLLPLWAGLLPQVVRGGWSWRVWPQVASIGFWMLWRRGADLIAWTILLCLPLFVILELSRRCKLPHRWTTPHGDQRPSAAPSEEAREKLMNATF